jgi:uncharacterized protein YjiK
MPLHIKIRKFWLTCYSGVRRLPALVIFLGLLSFCHTPNTSKYQDGIYDLDNPDYRYTMPKSLEEISGISWFGKGKLACIQDEDGMIFIFNLEKEKVTSTVEFGKDGDYEDISVVKNTAYVLKSNGHIFRVKNFKNAGIKVKRYKTLLSNKNDAEGMVYDSLKNRLLIACKGSPSIEKEKPYKGYRAVYSFDLETKQLQEEPVYLIDLRKIDSYKDQGNFTQFSSKLARILGITDPYTNLRPSGIAIHPLTDEIYIISSVGKLLIRLDRDGLVLGVQALDPNLFRQPEGICFSPGGDLYISNEGRGGKGYILKFKPKPDE